MHARFGTAANVRQVPWRRRRLERCAERLTATTTLPPARFHHQTVRAADSGAAGSRHRDLQEGSGNELRRVAAGALRGQPGRCRQGLVRSQGQAAADGGPGHHRDPDRNYAGRQPGRYRQEDRRCQSDHDGKIDAQANAQGRLRPDVRRHTGFVHRQAFPDYHERRSAGGEGVCRPRSPRCTESRRSRGSGNSESRKAVLHGPPSFLPEERSLV